MGAKQSRSDNQSSEKLLNINHTQFKNAILLKQSQDCLYINIKVPIHNPKQYQDWGKTLKQVSMEHQNLMIPKEILLQKQGTCGQSYFLNIFYPHFQVLLSDQIINRCRHNNEKFQQPQLWYLIFVLIQTGKNFHNKNKKIGDVKPQNIFMNQQGQIKIATHLSWPYCQDNYLRALIFNEITYLAPQQLQDIIFQKQQSVCNPFKAESFSVGLTCLDAATLSSSNSLYLPNHKFDEKLLIQRLNTLDRESYSQTLKSVIRSLCNMDPEKRGSCTYFYDWLQPYEAFIKRLETFQVSQQPSRIKYQSSIKYQSGTKKEKSRQTQMNMSKASKKEELIFIPKSSGRFNKKQNFDNPEELPIKNLKESNYKESRMRQTYSYNSPIITYNKPINQMNKTINVPPKNQISLSKNIQKMQQTDLTLQMIDKQLEKSRRMFPS